MSICKISLTAAFALSAIATPALAQDVEITLIDVRPGAGPLYIALQSEDQFMQEDGVAGEFVENPDSATLTFSFPDIPEGRYSFTVWHDLDKDGTFSIGAMGPTDGWTMPGAADLRGLPTFEVNSFMVTGPKTSVTEAMLYPQDAAQ